MGQSEFNRGPWTCRWASIAGAVRATRSIGSADVIWTCDRRDTATETSLFLREECGCCQRWEAAPSHTPDGAPQRLTLLLPDYTRPSPVLAKTHRYSRGERIFSEGAPSKYFYTTTSGSVKLVKTSLQGNDTIVAITSGICPLNPTGLDDGRSFLATAVALEDTTCIVVPKPELVALIEKHPAVALRLYRELCESLDSAFTQITELGHGTVEARLARLFLRLARSTGRREDHATFIPIHLSRQELADAVGTTIETCIRLMSRWGKQAFICVRDGGFVVNDGERLELLAHATMPRAHERRPSAPTRRIPKTPPRA